MDKRKLDILIKKIEVLDKNIASYFNKNLLFRQPIMRGEIEGHLKKAKHNLDFIFDTFEQGYFDWVITGCYYALYHSALSLILSKGYSSKNHDATICILIKEFLRDVDKDEIEFINEIFLDKEDLNFYVYSKNNRKDASYSSELYFDKENVAMMMKSTREFVNKVEDILNV